ncbi:MAG: hypothetical protein QS748_14505 [Candidatus Endonucleobacter bathymodioli]|uniref:J domain-containing protein n=1 Tax=Candidatus Endonucleibacter bathymodioli TaxID=539814 RepID=A0AA90SU48_9GAMM|nr:hypothetical protein [Candidatus Endonucleobacter bathymodioli]
MKIFWKYCKYNFIGNAILALSLSLLPIVSSAFINTNEEKNDHRNSIIYSYINNGISDIIGLKSELENILEKKESNVLKMAINFKMVEFNGEEQTNMLPDAVAICQNIIDTSDSQHIKRHFEDIKMELNSIADGLNMIKRLVIIKNSEELQHHTDGYIRTDKKSIMVSLEIKWFYIKRFKRVIPSIYVTSPSSTIISHVDKLFSKHHNEKHEYDNIDGSSRYFTENSDSSFATIDEKIMSLVSDEFESTTTGSEHDRWNDDDYDYDYEEEVEVEAEVEAEVEDNVVNDKKVPHRPTLKYFFDQMKKLAPYVYAGKWTNHEEKAELRSKIRRIAKKASILYHPDHHVSSDIEEYVRFNEFKSDLINAFRSIKYRSTSSDSYSSTEDTNPNAPADPENEHLLK